MVSRALDTVGVALLWTLEAGLGEAFTAEVRLDNATKYWPPESARNSFVTFRVLARNVNGD